MACEINVSGVFFPSRAKEAKKQKKSKITPDLRLTLGRKFDITHWFSCGADGLAYGPVITKISRVDRLPNFLRHVA